MSRRSGARGISSATSFVVGGHRKALVGLAATAFLGGSLEALFLVTATRAAFAITDGDDQIGVVGGRYLSVSATLLLGLLLIALRTAFSVLTAWQSARLSSTVVARIRSRLALAFLEAAWPAQQQERSGRLQELMSSYTSQGNSFMSGLTQGLVAAMNLLALMGLAVAIDPRGAVILLVSVALFGTVLRPFRSMVKSRSRLSTSAGMELATQVSEVSNLGLELHVFQVQSRAAAMIEDRIDEARTTSRRQQFAAGLTGPAYVGLAYVALIGALAVVAVSSATSLTSLGAAMLVMLRSLGYGQALQGSFVSLVTISPVVEEVMIQLDRFEAARHESGGEPVGEVRLLEAKGIDFSYIEGQPVLQQLSFVIGPNEIVGIVGPSGSGKSTLVQLLLGLRQPSAGSVLADGRDLRLLRRSDWARRVTFVPQAGHLIAGSVAENIRFLREDVSDETVLRAAELAHLHEDILRFPEGYQRQVGEHGGHLSGGQQQRLCIARALVEDPDVLILDEPTSALDVRSEHLVRTTLRDLSHRMSVIVIAHRLSTLDICDRIMVIQDGQLRGFDTPANLEASNDFYREALLLSGLRTGDG